MPEINILDKHTAELIAAGEVVERPASVIKELCENSIDAGASVITVEIRDGGISYIRITDNGCGISKNDVKKAFLRHATSKLKVEEDLSRIATLGFRGEALPSIASVARVDMLTKTADEPIGSLYCIHGSEEICFEDAGCPDGTTITVKDLFYNTPARMKFLKKNVSEGNAVADVIERLALSHPEVSFRFLRDGKEALLTPGDNKLISSIRAVYGKEFTQSLIPVEYSDGPLSVKGYISKPVYARATRAMQTFFVNGRFVKTGTGAAALSEAYKNSIMAGKFPACVLNVTIPFDAVDANVHPAKTEIRFSDERSVFSLIYYAAKSALSTGDTRPVATLSAADGIKRPASNPFTKPEDYKTKPEHVQTALSDISPASTPQKSDTLHTSPHTERRVFEPSAVTTQTTVRTTPDVFVSSDKTPDKEISVTKVFEKNTQSDNAFSHSVPTYKAGGAADIAEKLKNESTEKEDERNIPPKKEDIPVVQTLESPQDKPCVKLIGEAFNTYIFAETDNKIMVIDKHAAHERIIYDKLRSYEADTSSQLLLSPVRVRLAKAQYDCMISNIEFLRSTGTDIEDFGDGDLLVRGVPLLTETDDIVSFIEEIAQKLLENRSAQTDHTEWVYHSVACRAAVKAGDKNDILELKKLAERIATDDSVRYCPHGRPVAFYITRSELERNFGRI